MGGMGGMPGAMPGMMGGMGGMPGPGVMPMPQPVMPMPQPGMPVPQPGMAVPQPGMAVPLPDAAASQPGMALPQPGMAAPQPDMAATQPAMAATQPAMAAPQPDMSAPQPGMAMSQPGMPAAAMAMPQPGMPGMAMPGMAMPGMAMPGMMPGMAMPQPGMAGMGMPGMMGGMAGGMMGGMPGMGMAGAAGAAAAPGAAAGYGPVRTGQSASGNRKSKAPRVVKFPANGPPPPEGALLEAIKKRDSDEVQDILAHPEFEGLNYKDSDKRTALHWAGLKKIPEDVCLKIVNHKDFNAEHLNALDRFRTSILIVAASVSYVKLAMAILKNKDFTVINSKDAWGATCLHWAADSNLETVCEAILEHPSFVELKCRAVDERFEGKDAIEAGQEKFADKAVAVIKKYHDKLKNTSW
eukprot:gnl/TRDRNA2_/TRDRNA2_136411_c0_seq1.p1 gnl/TRDRNA2_/TRDRNA2_136411_c0~~gnl/TRDRNA2_/TRDRNA2_136411_c0_seq1.p1  ORF type:complete len:410 (-),score=84.64 gnl/TRDRNA2_/TRDRNA2_136411_c0_seq1:78-1307(-)